MKVVDFAPEHERGGWLGQAGLRREQGLPTPSRCHPGRMTGSGLLGTRLNFLTSDAQPERIVERSEKGAGLAEQTDLHLTIEGEDAGSASRQAQTLERLLLEQCPAARTRRIRTDAETMDGGATLAVALASPVLVE